MKAIIFLTAVLVVSILLFGCGFSTLGKLPYGVWQSEEPYIFLDVTYDGDIYNGKYEVNGEIIDIIFQFMVSHKAFTIFDPNARKDNVFHGDNPYLSGTYSYTKDKMVYVVAPYYAEICGYKKIVFTKIKDYNPEHDEISASPKTGQGCYLANCELMLIY